MVKHKKRNVLIILGIKTKQQLLNMLYENNTKLKTEITLIIGRSVIGKIFFLLSLLKDRNPGDVYIFFVRQTINILQNIIINLVRHYP